jgi:pimeloyl-ACP methyl ester carboxylesterase
MMQHGMWHGAWCWQTWQESLAEWGWESIAFSQPGHSASTKQKPIQECTLDYYLGFLKAEVDRLPRKPVLIGHSMGGALTQWYLKYVGILPAAVLVAPWPHEAIQNGTIIYLTMADPLGMLLSYLTRRAQQTRTPRSAAHALLSPDSIYTPEVFHARLSPESTIIWLQYTPFFWQAPDRVNTPMLVLAGECDRLVSVSALRKTAQHYRADFVLVDGAAHNIMMERTHQQTAQTIHDWLSVQGIS